MDTLTITKNDAIRGERWYEEVYCQLPHQQRGIGVENTYTCHCVVANAARRKFRKREQAVMGNGRIYVTDSKGKERTYTSPDRLLVDVINLFDNLNMSRTESERIERREKLHALLPITVPIERV